MYIDSAEESLELDVVHFSGQNLHIAGKKGRSNAKLTSARSSAEDFQSEWPAHVSTAFGLW